MQAARAAALSDAEAAEERLEAELQALREQVLTAEDRHRQADSLR